VIAAAGLLALAGGCASLGLGQQQGSDGGDAPDAAGAYTVARADTAPDGGDEADAAADTVGGASLRDSVIAELKARRAAADTTAEGGEETTGDDRERKVVAEEGPSGPVPVTDVDSLRSLGPVYTPYDVPPLLRRQGLENLLRATILPVIQRHDLEPDEWARFWVLVDEEGRVVEHRVHLGSGHTAFDEAAAAAARALRYRPARRDDEPVPVWVLVRISLLMDAG
jgi:TonB family protein